MEKEMVYLYTKSFIISRLLHDPKALIFVADVVVTNLTWEMVASNVINQPASVVAKFSTIVKIRKYRGFHEGHHFILMAMEVHGALGHDMDRFIMECAHLFHNKHLGGHLSLSFCI